MLDMAPVSPTLPVVDLERELRFYKEKLGINQKGETKFVTAVLECGNGTMLVLFQRSATKADNTAASFYVENVEETVRELTGNFYNKSFC